MADTANTAPLTLTVGAGGQKLMIPANADRIILQKKGSTYEALEIATLGESDVFVRRDAQGEMRLIYRKVRLQQSAKEIVAMGAGGWIITVAGYNKLNQTAGVYLLTPESLTVKGAQVANPYVEYSAEGEIERVIARKVAIGYSPVGNIVAIDAVRHYNFRAYYLQDLHAKTGKPNAARYGTQWLCPFAPEEQVTIDGRARYVKADKKVYTFRQVEGSEGIWIDVTNDEIQDVMKQHIQHQKFGDVTAQNLAARNALKAHPAISAGSVQVTGGVTDVMVFGWKHDMSRDEIRAMGDKIVRGEELAGVQVQHDEATVEAPEFQTGVESAIDETAAAEGGGEQEPATQVPLSELLGHLVSSAKAKGIDLGKLAKNLYQAKVSSLTGDQIIRMQKVVDGTPEQKKEGAK